MSLLVGWKHRVGKLRRFFSFVLAYPLVKKKLARRKGHCTRCGACCRLPEKCMFLVMENGKARCRVYRFRPPNCRIFPIDERDLEDRNRVEPRRPCGYYFE